MEVKLETAKRFCIGIDPGVSGAVAMISEFSNSSKIRVERFKKMTDHEIAFFFETLLIGKTPLFAVLERVHSFPGQGVSSTFKFGQSYGFILGLLHAFNIPFDTVTPQSWIKAYGMKKKKTESKTQWKNRLKARAQQYYPDMKITNDMADAILIARYCQLHHTK